LHHALSLTRRSGPLFSPMTKTLSLSELLRRPAQVKKLTAAGHRVRVTDQGRDLWDISPAAQSDANQLSEQQRIAEIDAFLDELVSEPRSAAPSLCQTILDARG
jgi:antitoxin (DNA-binding transcriptional repressor) of toxin-antitoxin stability system